MNDEQLARIRELIAMHQQYRPALSIEGETALLAEVDRLREQRDQFRKMMNSAVSAGVVMDGERLDALKEVERLEKVVADLKEINDRMGADRVRMADELPGFRSRDNPYAW